MGINLYNRTTFLEEQDFTEMTNILVYFMKKMAKDGINFYADENGNRLVVTCFDCADKVIEL